MRKVAALVSVFILVTLCVNASTANKFNLLVAPGTVTNNSATLLWDKQPNYTDAVYEILINGKVIGSTSKTNYTVSNLSPNVSYTAQIWVKQAGNQDPGNLNTLKFKTTTKGKIYNILNYGAKGDSVTKNTKAIQSAINACTADGIVYIPKGTFISGALFLKNNKTILISCSWSYKDSFFNL